MHRDVPAIGRAPGFEILPLPTIPQVIMDHSSSPVQTDADVHTERPSQSGTRYALPIDLEPATIELIGWWLADAGSPLRLDPGPGDPLALILVEMAYPRHDACDRLRAIAADWPDVPVILLSPTFFADTPCRGEVANRLRVAATLATPLSRDRFLTTVGGLLGPTR